MVTKESINKFFLTGNIAVAGVSRNNKKFGNSAYHYLKDKGFNVFQINPFISRIDDDICYKNLNEIPEKVESLLIVLPPEKSGDVLKEAFTLGIKNIWFQNGSESDEAVKACEEKGINTVYKQCVLMFIEPVTFPHNFHRWITKVTGKIPR
jgi:predicted CoA-binding protein